MLFEHSKGVHHDYREALELYTLAAASNHAAAQNNLGLMYYEAKGVGLNYAKVHTLWSAAAKQGHVDAQFNLGYGARGST
jgi:TPR repeat protein